MTLEEFVAGEWIDCLADALIGLAEAQEPFLREYWERNPRVHDVLGGRDGTPPEFPLGDLCDLYAMARHSHVFSEEKHYAPLCEVLDPVRHILISHPTLARVVGRIIGRDNFWMQILDTGASTSPTNIIAGLMARAAELSGDRFQTAVGELNAFLAPAGAEGSAGVLGGLDIGYDAVLFYGLTLRERIDVADGMALLPFEQVRAFVDENQVEELAAPGAGFHGWRSVGAAVRPFRWRPTLRRTGYEGEPELGPPGPFFREARTLLDLLAVAHATPVLPVASLAHCIDWSAGRLLGWTDHHGSFYPGRSAHDFDGFDESPELAREALAEAKEAFENRKSERFGKMAPIVARLAAALARNGRFEGEVRIVEVATALERMYELPEGKIAHTLRNRVSRYLESDTASRERVKESVKEFYDARSDIVHSRADKVSTQGNHAVFATGFDIARWSLFKLLREGPPDDWNALVVAVS